MSDAPLVYIFDPDTGEYQATEQCRADPRGGWFTYPSTHASRTHVQPPGALTGHARCFRSGEWGQIEDHRGDTVYSTTDGSVRVISGLGPLPSDVTSQPRPGEWYQWENGEWVERIPPAMPVILTYADFRARWTDEEKARLLAAKQQHWQVEDFVSVALAQGHVNLSGPTAAQAKATFVALGVLTAERADEIFAA